MAYPKVYSLDGTYTETVDGLGYARQAGTFARWDARYEDRLNYTIRDAEATLSALRSADVLTTLPPNNPKVSAMKPRTSDAQIRVNSETEWLAADVAFGLTPKAIAKGDIASPKYTYKAPVNAMLAKGLLAHGVTPFGVISSVYVVDVRTPTVEDKLTAHSWLIIDGDLAAQQANVARDVADVNAIYESVRATALEDELRKSLEKTAPKVVTPAPLVIRLGGKYNTRARGVVEVTEDDTGADAYPYRVRAGDSETYWVTKDGKELSDRDARRLGREIGGASARDLISEVV